MFYVGISAQRKGLCSHDFHRGVLKKKDTALTKILKKMSILSCHAQKAWYLTQLKLGS